MRSPITVLVVAAPEAKCVFGALPAEQATPFWAEDGEQALALLAEHPEIELLALAEPAPDWLPLARALPGREALPVLALAHNEQEAARALVLGATDVLRLPCAPQEAACRLNALSRLLREHSTEDKLTRTSIHLRSLVNTVPGGILTFELPGPELPGKTHYFNDGLPAMMGYTREEYLRLTDDEIRRQVADEDRARVAALTRELAAQPRRADCNFRVRRKDGEIRDVHMCCAPLENQAGLNVFNAVLLDVTKEKAVERQSELAIRELKYRAEHDALTGICNRESFFVKTEELFRERPDAPLILAVVDIDRFKVVNDLFGKEVGDRVLCCIADTLRRRFHGVGSFGRMESDQFALCCPESLLDCDALHRDFLACLANEGIDYRIEASFGLYRVHDFDVPVLKMCDRAAMAMRTVKNSAVRRCAYYDDQLRQSLLEEQEIIDSMNGALERGEFVPYVQPIYNISTGKPVSGEVLIRWRHPKRGFISPGLFVPLFERNGFITRLDVSVWESACRMLARWRDQGCPLPLSVNMSRVDLYAPRLCERLEALVQRYGIEPSMLKLEITESAYSEAPEALLAVINRLREMGFHILMDDFGSGYSSLNILKDMPVDTLKIDMRFLAELETSKKAASIITSVVRMAKWLDIPVIAEGVETQQQVDFLRSIGCDQVQGYFFAKPMPVEDFERLLAQAEPARPAGNVEPMAIDLSAVWDANAQFNLLLNGMISGMGLYELVGDTLEIQRVNDAYYALFGVTPSKLFTAPHNALLHLDPPDRPLVLAACHRAVETHQVQSVTVRRIHQDGHRMWIDIKLRYISRAGDHPVFYLTFTDVSQQKEFELARSFQQYTEALRSLYDVLIELDFPNDRYRVAYLAEGIRMPVDEARPLSQQLEEYLVRWVHPADRQALREAYQEVTLAHRFETKPHYRLEVRIRRGENGYRWYACYFFRFGAEQGRTLHLMGARDIDAQKRAQHLAEENHVLQAKQLEQERYQALMEESGTTLLEWDLGNNRFFASAGYKQWRLSEHTPLELVNGACDAEVCHPDDVAEARRTVRDALFHRDVNTVLRLIKTNGATAWCRVAATVSRDEQGAATRVAVILSEIDEQIRAREDQLRAQAQFQAFADNFMVGLGIYEVREGRSYVRYLSDGYYRMMGFEDKEAFSRAFSGAYLGVHPDDHARFDEALEGLIQTGKSFVLEYRAYARDGSMLWLRSQTCVLPGQTEGPMRLLAVIVDITELKTLQREKEIEKDLRIERKYRQALLSETLYVYDLTDDGCTLLHAMPGAEERFLPWEAYVPREANLLNFHPDDGPALLALLRDELAGGEPECKHQLRIRDLAGGWVWVEASLHNLTEAEIGQPRLLLYLKVVDQQKRREAELLTRAEVDRVSGVFNRATTEQRVNAALSENALCAFLLIDVDNFKRINDSLGHAAGDQAIHAIGEALRGSVRAGDVVGRVGGDEFVVLLADIARPEDAVRRAERLLAQLHGLCLNDACDMRSTVSIGLAVAPEDGASFAELYRKSDAAMYQAKDAGKGRLMLYQQQ